MRLLTRRDTPLLCCSCCLAWSLKAAFPASAAVDHVVAQTAAFSGADVLLRGALAVAPRRGLRLRAAGNETAAETLETDLGCLASLAETEAQLGVMRDQLDVQSARSDALERENAALAAALEEAARDAGRRAAPRRAVVRRGDGASDGAGREPGAPDRGAAC